MHRGLPWRAKKAGSGSVPQMSKPWVTSGTASSTGTSSFTPLFLVTTRVQMMHAYHDADMKDKYAKVQDNSTDYRVQLSFL